MPTDAFGTTIPVVVQSKKRCLHQTKNIFASFVMQVALMYPVNLHEYVYADEQKGKMDPNNRPWPLVPVDIILSESDVDDGDDDDDDVGCATTRRTGGRQIQTSIGIEGGRTQHESAGQVVFRITSPIAAGRQHLLHVGSQVRWFDTHIIIWH